MRKHTKIIVFIVTALFNALFLYLCGYGLQVQPHTNGLIEPVFGVIAIALLAVAETSVVQQVYLKDKFKKYQRRLFDYRLWRQCVALVFYYAVSIFLVVGAAYVYNVFYVAVAALVLSMLWMTGSRTLWLETSAEVGIVCETEKTCAEDGGNCETEGDNRVIGYYLADLGKLYEVYSVMENDDVVEIFCRAQGDRERTITIAKKKQKLAQ